MIVLFTLFSGMLLSLSDGEIKRMVRKLSKKMFWRKVLVSFWLLWSMSASILFSFGLLARINENGSLYPVFIGLGMIVFAIFLGTFRTETSTAMKRNR